ncbi:hypothetical protein BGZ92_000024 [Podila epicladia]|nr:hypothetical protein BGZ92_000024 [Podila epicladia]
MYKKFAEIPELVTLVSRYLTTQDLFVCVRVSIQWHHLFIPFLWHTVNDTTLSWTHILYQRGNSGIRSRVRRKYMSCQENYSDKNKGRDWLMHIFRKYGHHSRNLTIHCPMVLEAASMVSLDDTGTSIVDDSRYLSLRSLTLQMRTPHPPQSVIPCGGHNLNSPSPPPVATLPLATSAPLFSGVVQENDYIRSQHFGLTLEAQEEALESGWPWSKHYWNLIFRNRGLVRLHLDHINIQCWSAQSTEVFLRGVAKLKHLKEFRGLKFESLSGIWELLAAVPTLESLTTSFNHDHDQLPDPLPEMNTTLRTLTVHNGFTINGLLDLLSLFPNLSSLTVPIIGAKSTRKSSEIMTLAGLGDIMADLFVPEHILPRDPSVGANLRELVAMTVVDYTTFLKHLPDHVELTWFDGSWTRGHMESEIRARHDEANELLVTSSRLRVFDSIWHYIRVDEMLRQPWACMGLEWLSCQIIGMERLDAGDQFMVDRVMAPGYSDKLDAQERAAVDKFERCRDLHHRVYDRLASLTKLKHLDLGFEDRDLYVLLYNYTYYVDGKQYFEYGRPPFDTLELSLASGLDRLGALKNLEMIGFECINHQIGQAELEWMAKSWPKLNLMRGLAKEKLNKIEHCKERAALKEYFQQLRPDVVHECLLLEE